MFVSKIIDSLYLFYQGVQEDISGLFDVFYTRFFAIIIIGVNAFTWLSAYIISATTSEGLVILHYNVDFGVNLIGDTSRIYVIPFLGLIIFLISIILLSVFYRRKTILGENYIFLSYLVFSTSLLSNIFLLIAVSSVYLINFR